MLTSTPQGKFIEQAYSRWEGELLKLLEDVGVLELDISKTSEEIKSENKVVNYRK